MLDCIAIINRCIKKINVFWKTLWIKIVKLFELFWIVCSSKSLVFYEFKNTKLKMIKFRCPQICVSINNLPKSR